jgi:hypothetical protein
MNRHLTDALYGAIRTTGVTACLLLGLTLLLNLYPTESQAAPLPSAAALPGRASGTPEPPAPQPRVPAVAPDLVIDSLTLDPPNPAPGQPATVTVVIKNSSANLGWDGFYTYLYIDPPQRPPTTTTPDTNYVGWFLGLNTGATFTWSYTDYTFAEPGCDHVIYAWVDRDNAIAEENDANNTASLNVCVGGAVGDPYEPDDTCAAATQLSTNGVSQAHTFAPTGDEDWYKFDGVGGVEYVIAARNVGANARTVLTLLPRCSQTATFGGGTEIRLRLPTSGTYYVRARNENAQADNQTEYTIAIQSPFDCSGFHEPNDTRAAAKDITTDGAPQQHRFCAPNDEDWVKFPVQSGTAYTARAIGVGANAAPTLVGSYGANAGDSLFGNPFHFTATTDGTYYLRATNTVTTTYGPTTDYTLAVTAQTCAPDAFEPDNSRAEAKPIVINGNPDARTACPAGDQDWVALSFTAGVTYTLETVPLGAASDTVICLFDNIGTQIACDDESGANHGSRITWQASATGDYYAQIRQASETAAGPATAYEFSVVTGICQPDLYEPDDSPDAAGLLAADGGRQARNFCSAADHDWIRLSIPAAGPYTIQTSGLAPGSDTQITIYDADRTTALASNDDYGPGLGSQIVTSFPRAGTFYAEVRHFNPARFGRSTSYLISAAAGTPTATPTPGAGSPSPTPTATPQPSGVQTLILTNRARLESAYGAARTAALFGKLDALANHPQVRGEIVTIEDNDTVAAAYAAWVAEQTQVDLANQVASAVRGLAQDFLRAHASVQYVILIGDDRVIPARRVRDRTSFAESQYTSLSTDTTVGAALAQDFFLTDDYYVDREPSTWEGTELYIPDWPIGRLIETPEEMVGMIDTFLASSQLTAGRALITGYDFVQDVAINMCGLYGQDIGNASIDCTLIGDAWSRDQLRSKQTNASPPFKLQAINGHANHAAEGVPVGGAITSRDIVSGTSDLSGGLIYSVGCHAGLNVPETSSYALDLPQAFAQKRANYAGNTGFGWGSRIGAKLSERLMQNFTQELLKGTNAAIGRAMMAAKQRYYQEADGFDEKDEKVLQQVTLYGFPMYRVDTGAVLGDDDPFPSVTISSPFGAAAAQAGTAAHTRTVSGQAGVGTVSIHVGANAQIAGGSGGFSQITTDWGSYYRLDGHTNTQPTGPIQPQVYAQLNPPAGQRLRGAVFTGGHFITTSLDPVIDAPLNEYLTVTDEPAFASAGFYPPVPFVLHGTDSISLTGSTLAVVMGQYDTGSSQQRLYSDVLYDVYFSSSADQAGPTIVSIDGYFNTQTQQATFKVEATDPMTVTRVLIAYSTGAGSWSSFDLTYNQSAHKWTGALPGVRGAQYYVQAVDSAGNASAVTRKGGYFRLEDVEALFQPERRSLYLPLMFK